VMTIPVVAAVMTLALGDTANDQRPNDTCRKTRAETVGNLDVTGLIRRRCRVRRWKWIDLALIGGATISSAAQKELMIFIFPSPF